MVEPGAIAAAAEAETQAANRRDQIREALARDLEAACYGADRTFRQYDAAVPENRLVAGEARWNRALARASEIEARIAAHDAAVHKSSAVAAMDAATLGANLRTVWAAPTTDARLKKRIVLHRHSTHDGLTRIEARQRAAADRLRAMGVSADPPLWAGPAAGYRTTRLSEWSRGPRGADHQQPPCTRSVPSGGRHLMPQTCRSGGGSRGKPIGCLSAPHISAPAASGAAIA